MNVRCAQETKWPLMDAKNDITVLMNVIPTCFVELGSPRVSAVSQYDPKSTGSVFKLTVFDWQLLVSIILVSLLHDYAGRQPVFSLLDIKKKQMKCFESNM